MASGQRTRIMQETTLCGRIAHRLERLSDTTGHLVSWATLGMVLLTFGVVRARYFSNSGSIAVQEAILYLHASVFMLGAAYTLRQDKHVRVDILYSRLGPRGRAWVDLLGAILLLLPVCLFLIWMSLDYVAAAWGMNQGLSAGLAELWAADEGVFQAFLSLNREGSREAGGLPLVFLLKTLLLLMPLLLLAAGTAQALRAVLRIREAN